MATSFVRKTTLGAIGSGTTVSTGAFAANPSVGDYVVAWAWGYSGTTLAVAANVTCADNIGGNAYTQVGFQSVVRDASNRYWVAMFHAKVAATGANFAPAITTSIAGSGLQVCAAEFSGVAATAPADGAAVSASAPGPSSSSPAPGSKSFAAGDVVCAVMVNAMFVSPQTVTTPSGFTSVQKETDGVNFLVGEGVYAVAPTSPTNPTWNAVADAWAASQFALLAAAAPAAAYVPRPSPGIPTAILAV
jgi:hypothetical protein